MLASMGMHTVIIYTIYVLNEHMSSHQITNMLCKICQNNTPRAWLLVRPAYSYYLHFVTLKSNLSHNFENKSTTQKPRSRSLHWCNKKKMSPPDPPRPDSKPPKPAETHRFLPPRLPTMARGCEYIVSTMAAAGAASSIMRLRCVPPQALCFKGSSLHCRL